MAERPTMAQLVRDAKAEILEMLAVHAEHVWPGEAPADVDEDRFHEAHERAAAQVRDELYRRATRLMQGRGQ